MKITILTGSPHIDGTTDVWAEQFKKGAEEAGHEVVTYAAGRMQVHPCQGCYGCRGGRCSVYRDDMDAFCEDMLSSDLIAFVTPLYFYGMSGSMKVVIDRFLCMNSRIKDKHMKSVMMCAGWNTDRDCMDGVKRHYEILSRYMKWQDQGQLYAFGCTGPSDLSYGGYDRKAYELGRSL